MTANRYFSGPKPSTAISIILQEKKLQLTPEETGNIIISVVVVVVVVIVRNFMSTFNQIQVTANGRK